MLSDDCEALWQIYLSSERDRIRSKMTVALRNFVDSFSRQPVDVRERWVYEFVAKVVDGGDGSPVRMPFFREVLFPELLAGYYRGEKGCARWLAGFSSLLYNSPECRVKLPEGARSEYGLLRHAIEREPKDFPAKQKLLSILQSRFEYALHELPTGVLYGIDGATPSECNEMADELGEFEVLADECGIQAQYRDLIEEIRFHINAYRRYLIARKSGDSYEAFLALQKGMNCSSE